MLVQIIHQRKTIAGGLQPVTNRCNHFCNLFCNRKKPVTMRVTGQRLQSYRVTVKNEGIYRKRVARVFFLSPLHWLISHCYASTDWRQRPRRQEV